MLCSDGSHLGAPFRNRGYLSIAVTSLTLCYTSVTLWGCVAVDPKISLRRLLIDSYTQ